MFRYCYPLLLAISFTSQLGCCAARAPWPCGHMWYGCQCGEIWWNEWFSSPPCCCDPCCGGEYTGPVRDSTYSQGTSDDIRPKHDPAPADGKSHPTSQEELPPGEPVTGYFRNEFGEQVSYDMPVDSRRGSRTLGNRRRLSDYVR